MEQPSKGETGGKRDTVRNRSSSTCRSVTVRGAVRIALGMLSGRDGVLVMYIVEDEGPGENHSIGRDCQV